MDIFECSICLEEFKHPVVISCGHTFCKGCLLQLKQLSCPTCRLNFDSVESLPSNFVVLQWMEENNNKNNTEKNPNKKKRKFIQCENCDEEKQAEIWCENCATGTYYCKDCEASVHSAKATRSHVRLGLNEKKRKPNFPKCEKHLEENKFYCGDCSRLICSVCVVDDHPGHKTMSIFKYGDILRNELKTSVSKSGQLIEHFNGMENRFDGEIKSLEYEKEKLRMRLNEIDDDLVNKKGEKEKVVQQRKNVETSNIVLRSSIDEMGVMELMDKDSIELMKNRIKKIDEELCPIEIKQLAQQEERGTRVDLCLHGKKQLVKWDIQRGYNIDFNDHFQLFSVLIKSTSAGHSLWIDNIQYPVTETHEGDNWYKLNLTKPIFLSQANISVLGKTGASFSYTLGSNSMRETVGKISLWSTRSDQPFEKFSNTSNNTYSLDMILNG